MNNFTKGMLVGVGIGLLMAPLSGEETRRVLATRMQEWRDSLPEDSRLNHYAAQVSERVNSTRENWRGYAQQAVSKAKDTGSAAMQSGQEMASKARQASQEMASRAKQAGQEMASKTKQGAGLANSSSNGSSTRVIPEIAD